MPYTPKQQLEFMQQVVGSGIRARDNFLANKEADYLGDQDPYEAVKASTSMKTTVPGTVIPKLVDMGGDIVGGIKRQHIQPLRDHWWERYNAPAKVESAAWNKGFRGADHLTDPWKHAPHMQSEMKEGMHYARQQLAMHQGDLLARAYEAKNAVGPIGKKLVMGLGGALLPFHAASAAGEAAYQGGHTPTEEYERRTGLNGLPARAVGVMADVGDKMTFGAAPAVGRGLAKVIDWAR